MRNFKGIIMSMYTSKLTILRHFLKPLSMIHMPPKSIASTQWCSRKYLGTGAVENISKVLFL